MNQTHLKWTWYLYSYLLYSILFQLKTSWQNFNSVLFTLVHKVLKFANIIYKQMIHQHWALSLLEYGFPVLKQGGNIIYFLLWLVLQKIEWLPKMTCFPYKWEDAKCRKQISKYRSVSSRTLEMFIKLDIPVNIWVTHLRMYIPVDVINIPVVKDI